MILILKSSLLLAFDYLTHWFTEVNRSDIYSSYGLNSMLLMSCEPNTNDKKYNQASYKPVSHAGFILVGESLLFSSYKQRFREVITCLIKYYLAA